MINHGRPQAPANFVHVTQIQDVISETTNMLGTINSQASNDALSTGELRHILTQLVTTPANLATSVGFISQSYDNITRSMSQFTFTPNKHTQVIEQLQNDMSQLRDANFDLSSANEELRQYSFRENINISGIPEANDEDVFNYLEKIGEVVRVPINRNDVSIMHRSFKPKTRPGETNARPANIVVRMVRREQRNRFIKACRARKPKLSDIGGGNCNANFYVNEHLTPNSKKLLSCGKNKGPRYGMEVRLDGRL